jgi:hypothetical protein
MSTSRLSSASAACTAAADGEPPVGLLGETSTMRSARGPPSTSAGSMRASTSGPSTIGSAMVPVTRAARATYG